MVSMSKALRTLMAMSVVVFASMALAEEEGTVTPSGGAFSLYSKPSGALIYVSGDYDFVGHTPCQLPFGLVGTYKVKALKRGYETWSTKVTLVGDRQNSLYIKLISKSRFKAAWRSLLFPGWGQFYSNRKTKGVILGVLNTTSLLATINSYKNYEDAKDDYEQALSQYRRARVVDEIPRLRKEMEKRAREADQAYELRTAFTAAAAILWVYNVMDAVFFFPRYKEDIYERATPLITGQVHQGQTKLLLTKHF
jgi:TM2 domain-containing membrane protein YozV